MTAYVVLEGEIKDQDVYDRYKVLSGPSVKAAGGKFIARGGKTDQLEGASPLPRTVLIEFESMKAARDWYDGDAYQEALAIRRGAVTVNAYIVDGLD